MRENRATVYEKKVYRYIAVYSLRRASCRASPVLSVSPCRLCASYLPCRRSRARRRCRRQQQQQQPHRLLSLALPTPPPPPYCSSLLMCAYSVLRCCWCTAAVYLSRVALCSGFLSQVHSRAQVYTYTYTRTRAHTRMLPPKERLNPSLGRRTFFFSLSLIYIYVLYIKYYL